MASLRPRFGVELDFVLPKLIGRTGAANGSQAVRLFVMTERDQDAAGNSYYAVAIEVPPAGVPAHAVQVPGQTVLIDEPLGLSGVRLDSFSLAGRVYSAPAGSGGGATMDLVLRAAVTFLHLDGFRLSGALAVQAGVPVLAAVQLQPSQPVTLTKLMTGLIGIDLSFAAAITDAIAFVSGSFYWMATPATGSGPNSLTLAIDPSSPPATYTPGYHVSGTLDLFGGHRFVIDLGVAAGVVTLTTSTDASFDLYFLTLNQTRISYIDGGSSGSELQVSTVANVFGTDIAATFSAVDDHFEADIGASGCTVSFAWSQANGMQIVGMDGLLASASDAETMIAKFEDWVHATGGSCSDLLTKWFDDIGKITFTPGLDGSPTRSGTGMTVPLKLTYTFGPDGHSVSSSIHFEADVAMPHGLSDLPNVIVGAIVSGAESIADAMFEDPANYAVVLWLVAKAGGASAFARAICRALEEALEDLAKDLADTASRIVAETLAEAAELAAQLIAVALLGLGGVLSLLAAVLDEIKGWFGKSDKDKAHDAIYDSWAKARAETDRVDANITYIQGVISPARLVTGFNANGQVFADAQLPAADQLGSTARLDVKLKYRSGAPGIAGNSLLDVTDPNLPDVRELATIAPSSATDFELNASIQTMLSGFTFIDPNTYSSLQGQIGDLGSHDDDLANEYAAWLQNKLSTYDSYGKDGIPSNEVFASPDEPVLMTVGGSRLGLTSRVG